VIDASLDVLVNPHLTLAGHYGHATARVYRP
jgi:hypothetical protein